MKFNHHFEPFCEVTFWANVESAFPPYVKLRLEGIFVSEYLVPDYESWPATLGVPSIHIQEPMFQISCRFESILLGFESLKVGQFQFSSFCTLHTFLGSPVWRAIKFDQLIIILKFLLHCIVDVRNLLCFKFQLLTNPFEWFSNAIPNGISKVSLVVRDADQSKALFKMS